MNPTPLMTIQLVKVEIITMHTSDTPTCRRSLLKAHRAELAIADRQMLTRKHQAEVKIYEDRLIPLG